MLGEGMKVRFCPYFAASAIDTPQERAEKMVTGIISYINWEHRFFLAEYDCGGAKLTECFKFWQIGNEVSVCGRF